MQRPNFDLMVLTIAIILTIGMLFTPSVQAGKDNTHGWKTGIFIEGATLRGGANGLAFDTGNRLFIANVFGGTITVVDPNTGEQLDQLDAQHGVIAVDDLHFGSDGSLFWTDVASGSVIRRSPGVNGMVSSVDGVSVAVVVNRPAVNPITVTNEGRVFFGECFAPAGGVFEILNPYDDSLSPLRTILDGIPDCASNGMDFRDGILFTPRWFEDRILSVDAETGAIVGEILTGHVPTAAKIHGEDLYWVSQETGGVYRADPDEVSPVPQLIAQLTPGLDNLAFDSQGRLFVSSFANSSIVEVLEDGSLRTVIEGGMVIPKGVGVIGDIVYTGDPAAVRGFNRFTGEIVSEIISVFSIGPLTDVRGLSSDGQHLFLTSWVTGSLQIFDPVTENIIAEASFGGGPSGATRFRGDLVVAEMFAGLVTRATGPNLEDREILAEVPGASGLAAHGGDLYVTSNTLGEVWQIMKRGRVMNKPIVVAAGLHSPEGITVMPSGKKLAVVEVATGSVREINLRNGKMKTIATGLGFEQSPPGLVAFWLNGVDIDDRGNLYVNGDAANVIYKISRRHR